MKVPCREKGRILLWCHTQGQQASGSCFCGFSTPVIVQEKAEERVSCTQVVAGVYSISWMIVLLIWKPHHHFMIQPIFPDTYYNQLLLDVWISFPDNWRWYRISSLFLSSKPHPQNVFQWSQPLVFLLISNRCLSTASHVLQLYLELNPTVLCFSLRCSDGSTACTAMMSLVVKYSRTWEPHWTSGKGCTFLVHPDLPRFCCIFFCWCIFSCCLLFHQWEAHLYYGCEWASYW